MAAALAYYGMFSLAPIIFIGFSIASLVVKQFTDYTFFYQRLEIMLGPEVAQWVQDSVLALGEKTFGGSTLVTIISVIALLIAASGMFFQIQFALNAVFKSPPVERDQTKNFILQRLFSFLMILGVGLLLIVASLLNVALNWFGSILGNITGSGRELVVLDFLALFGLITLSFATIYKILPSAKIAWRDVWPGAALAAIITLLAGMLLGIYFRIGGVGSAFEAAGTVTVILIAINVIAQIFLFGALFTREYAHWYGSGKSMGEEADA